VSDIDLPVVAVNVQSLVGGVDLGRAMIGVRSRSATEQSVLVAVSLGRSSRSPVQRLLCGAPS